MNDHDKYFRADVDPDLDKLEDAAYDLAHFVDASVTLVDHFNKAELTRLLTAVNEAAAVVLDK